MSEASTTPKIEQLSLQDNNDAGSSSTAPAAAAPADRNGEEAPVTNMTSASLYVGELNPSVTEAILFEIFSTIGPVASIRVCRDAVTRESLGYSYVNFHNAADARKALEELNYALIKGRPCRIMWSQRDPSVRRSGKGNIFIKNLDPTIDNKALHDTFSAFGDVLSCKVVTNHMGQSLGFGFIHYADPSSADEAIQTVNGMVLNGRPVYVAHHIPKNERESHAEAMRAKFTNVYVKNLDQTEVPTQSELEKMFTPFGKITSAVLATDAEGKSKGFGFVNFADHESAHKAVEELNDKEIAGKKLYVGRAQTKFERQSELKKQHEQARLERLTKYQGINLYVKNLEDTVTDEKLHEAFVPFGQITSAKVMTDDHGKSRGFGFVCYSTPEEANRAISEMNQHILGSKPLYVALAQRKDLRQSQMRQQLSARNQLRLQQQAAVAGGLPPQFLGGAPPLMYGAPGGPQPFAGPPGAPLAPGAAAGPGGRGQRLPFPPAVVPPMGQWPPRGYPAGPAGPAPTAPGAAPTAPAAAAKPESLEEIVAKAPEEAHKQIIGEALYPKILASEGVTDPELAGKITGMLLDMDNSDLFALAENDDQLKEQVDEALQAYHSFLESQQQ